MLQKFFRRTIAPALPVLALFLIGSLTPLSGASALQPAPTPTRRPPPDRLPISLRAPWPAGITWHAGSDGSYYHNCDKSKGQLHCNWDDLALDFNGTSTAPEQIDDGTLVLAAADGTVSEAGCSAKGYGYTVIINHGYGIQSQYSHLGSSLFVDPGEWVAQGTPLGYVDGTAGANCGGKYGKHLHFAVHYCDPNDLVYSPSSGQTGVFEYRCGSRGEKIQAMLPEPLDGVSPIRDADQILSRNYGIGYEAFSNAAQADYSKIVRHNAFFDTYKTLGGNFIFGMSEGPVKPWNGSGTYYQAFAAARNPSMPWDGMKSGLVENNNIAYFVLGPIWEKYQAENGPTGRLGLPVSHTYEYGYLRPGISGGPGYRADFEHGSILVGDSGVPEILDSFNAHWSTKIFADTAFQDLRLARRDRYIDYQWVPEMPGDLNLDAHLGPAVVWEGTVGGLVTFYQLGATVQGHVEIFVDGRQVLKIDSPDREETKETLSFSWNQKNLQIRFWQDIGKPARIKLSAKNVFPVPEVFASEGSLTADSLPDSNVDYTLFEGPPYPDQIPADETAPPPPAGAKTATALVVDVSGSMGDAWQGGIKIESARAAANQIVNMLEQDSRIGSSTHTAAVVSFSESSMLNQDLTADFNLVRSSLNTLGPISGTNIGSGIVIGNEVLGRTIGGETRIMILLSDGMTNFGMTPSEILSGPVQDAVRLGVCIYTIGFGDPGNLDEPLLQEIARTSGCGEYYYATNVSELEKIYIRIRHRSSGTVLAELSGSVAHGQTVHAGVIPVPAGQSELAISLHWPGSRLGLILYDPTGAAVAPTAPGIQISTYSNLVYTLIGQPMPGEWRVDVVGIEVPQSSEPYDVIASGRAAPVVRPPTPPRPAPSSGGASVALLIVLIGGGVVGLYVYASVLNRRRPRRGRSVPLSEPSHATLKIIRGANRGGSFPIVGDGYTIGRSSSNTLQLLDPGVSRRHAVLRYAQGGWHIQDQNSRAGVFVNGINVQGVRLQSGDRIVIGSTEMEFRC